MKTLTCLEASQDIEAVLDIAYKDGAVRIRRKDGIEFILQPAKFRRELLGANSASSEYPTLDADADPINPKIKITTDEIVEIVRQSRGGPI